jgi:purine catabolism regulator
LGEDHTGGGLTVRQAMLLPGLREARAIAGCGGLDRRITGVRVLEAPETLRSVVAGDLLLTMGFAFKDDSYAQSSVVGNLARAGSAGLVVRPEPYLGEIPLAMAAQANELAYPLLAIPEHVAYEHIALPIVQEQLMAREARAQQSFDTYRRFTQLVVEGAGVQGLLQALGELLLGFAAFADPELNVLARYVPSSQQRPQGETAGSGRWHELLELGSLDSMVHSPRRSSERGPDQTPEMLAEGIVAPLVAGHDCHGYVFAIPNPEVPRDFAMVTLEHAASALALQLLKDREVAQAEYRVRGELADDLLAGSYGDEEDVFRRARFLRYELSVPHALLLVKMDEFARRIREGTYDKTHIAYLRRQFLGLVTGAVDREYPRHLVRSRSDSVVLLLPVPQGSADVGAIEQLAHRIVQAVTESALGIAASVAIGPICRKPGEFRSALTEAQRAAGLAAKLGKHGQVIPVERLGIYRFLAELGDRTGLEAFAKQLLEPLVNYDRARGTPFLRTLEIYLQQHGNLMHTARELHVHLNTLRYRLARISEISGIDLKDEDLRLDLLLALRIRAMLDLD